MPKETQQQQNHQLGGQKPKPIPELPMTGQAQWLNGIGTWGQFKPPTIPKAKPKPE